MADFTMFAGDSQLLEVTVTNAAGDPVDLDGVQAIRWWMSWSVHAEPPLVEKAIGSGVTIVDASAGRFNVTLAPADTAGLSGPYYFEAEVIDEVGNVSTVLTGTATIRAALIPPAA